MPLVISASHACRLLSLAMQTRVGSLLMSGAAVRKRSRPWRGWVGAAFKKGVHHLRSYEHVFRGWILGLPFFGAPPGNFENSCSCTNCASAVTKSHKYLLMLG